MHSKPLLGMALLMTVFQQTDVFAQSGDALPDSTFTEVMEESVITSFRQDMTVMESPTPISIVKEIEYRRNSNISLPSTLSRVSGVSYGSDGVWSGNIVIHGLGSTRIVTLIDGCRIEVPSDLAVSLNMCDVYDIRRTELIKGAESYLYGSGAMGGIVNIITKSGEFNEEGFTLGGEVLTSYSSVNNCFNPHLRLQAASGRWWASTSVSYSGADDISTPIGMIDNSGFSSYNADVKLGVRTAQRHTLSFNLQRSLSKDVGIPGGAAFSKEATATFDKVERNLASVGYAITNPSSKVTAIQMKGYMQSVGEYVTMTLPSPSVKISPYGRHNTSGFDLQTTIETGDHNDIVCGAELWRRSISSLRVKEVGNIRRIETPLPRASFTSGGIFFRDRLKLDEDRITIVLGGRIDLIGVKNKECHDFDSIYIGGVLQPLTGQRVTFSEGKKTDFSLSADIGLIAKAGERSDVTLNLARAFRAASLEERFKYIDLTSKVQLGDPDLKPEKSYTAQLSFRHRGKILTLTSSLYVNYLTDMISEKEGSFTYHLTGDGKQQTLPALIAANIDKALIYGADLDAECRFTRFWSCAVTASYVRGRDLLNKQSLRGIPPTEARWSLSYAHPDIISCSITLITAAARTQRDIAPSENTTDAWYRLDAAANSPDFNLGRCILQLYAGVDNITDKAYTNFLSTNRSDIRLEPGRNIYLKAYFKF